VRSKGQRLARAAFHNRTGSYGERVEFDYDKQLWETIQRGLEEVLKKLTPEQLAELESKVEDVASLAVTEAIESTAKAMVEQLKRDSPGMLEHQRDFHVGFAKRLAEHWGRAFDLSEMVMKVAYEAGEFFYEKHVPQDGQRDVVFEVLSRLLARACRIAEEVLVLLKAGYGQAGLARWRALHEVAVVADFIATNGADTAERYLAHEAVESWKAMQEFQKHAVTLGEKPYCDGELDAARATFDRLIAQYGRPFAGSYGWAQAALAARDPRYAKTPATIGALEDSVGTPHMRPRYRMASHGVHANPKGITWTPDLLPADRGVVLLTGPSPAGLADSGHATLISLTRVTAAALASKRGEATGLILKILLQLTDEAGQAYLEAHRALEEPRNDEPPT
jgi:Family of unknown function (DUF5677)